jgi:hypothetical protein
MDWSGFKYEVHVRVLTVKAGCDASVYLGLCKPLFARILFPRCHESSLCCLFLIFQNSNSPFNLFHKAVYFRYAILIGCILIANNPVSFLIKSHKEALGFLHRPF